MAKHGTVGIGYSRRSLVYGRADESSIERQDSALMRAIESDGLTPRMFSDAKGHRSGKHDRDRPQYRAAIALVPDPSTRTIYFDLLDRAWRNVEEWNKMVRLCREHDVSIKLVSMFITIDSELDPFRKLMLDNLASAAEFESNVASYRQKKEVRHKKAHGVYWGGTPFGSQRVGVGLDARMVRHVQTLADGRVIDHGATVAQLLELYASGLSFKSIRDSLNAEGYQHLSRQNALVPFGVGAVQSIAWNVLFYAGYLVVDRRWKSKHSKILLEGEGTWLARYARAMGAVPSPQIEPLISQDLANRALASRYARRRSGQSVGKFHTALLTPIAWHRGLKLRAQARETYYVYRTRGANSVQFRGDAIDGELLSHLSRIVFPAPLQAVLQEMRKQQDDSGELARRDELARRLRGKLSRLKELYAEGIMSRAEFDAAYQTAHAELLQAENAGKSPDALDTLLASLTSLSVLEQISITRRKAAIQHLFERVEIGDNGNIERLHPKTWARQAFGILLGAMREMYQRYPRQDLNPSQVHLQWLHDTIAI